MKTILRCCVIFAILCSGQTLKADQPPALFTDTLPELTIAETLSAYFKLNGEQAAIPPKQRELISLAVSAQIPCVYCIYVHRVKAKAAGANEEEIRQAVALAGFVRLMSTNFFGAEYDMEEYKKQVDALFAE